MLLKLPCRFGEIFEAEAGGEKKEFILTGFSHGIWDTPDISVSEFPVAGSRLSLSMDAAPTEYTLELPHDLYEHQSSENFGFARKVKGLIRQDLALRQDMALKQELDAAESQEQGMCMSL